jgi:plasmid maintenance system antidote protein VapI
VSEKEGREELQEEIERGHLVRAAQIAQAIGLPREEVQDIVTRALWEMAAVNRNALGTKRLAQVYGISKEELKELLEGYAGNRIREGDCKALEPCYDINTGAYLRFEEWMDSLVKKYDKVSVA